MPPLLDTDERQELTASVRASCERLLTEDRLRRVIFEAEGPQRGFDADLWRTLCDQIGVGAIAIPERHGGAGYGADALAAVAHEIGRTLAPVPLTSFVLGVGLLLDTAAEHLLDRALPPLLAADRTVAAALTGDGGPWTANAVSLSARPGEAEWLVDGEVRHVLHGAAADDLVFTAVCDDGIGLFHLDIASSTVDVRPEDTLDRTRPMATMRFSCTHAVRLHSGDVSAIVERNVIRTLAVLAAEQVGACERVLEIATEYACTRQQFGRPIGSFQAIKHKCSDMLLDLEWSRSASQAAVQGVDADDPDAWWLASMAKAVCSEALRRAAHANVQIHGGIGFTWEHVAHLYLKRARTDEVLFGTPGTHLDRLAAVTGVLPAGSREDAS